ncbi:hypothetical protein JHD50_06705 [Sulfurimonas sp. MAG313]|nr:hypothetical protein [Sulfurimonas sp. MAG313]MDF1880995.1 hypothetical protein [Sulfurimonas sp. MAG313]
MEPIFFGDKALVWYDHKDDMGLNLSTLVYTREDFDIMNAADQKTVLSEVATACINKRHFDNLSCQDTSYWLADSLEKKGVDTNLALDWIKPCRFACESGSFDPVLYAKMNPSSVEEEKKKSGKSEGTQWIWEKN